MGSCTSTPRDSIGVTTMKMMSSTSTTSTSGVTLMSAITPEEGLAFTVACRAPRLPRDAIALAPGRALAAAAFLQNVIHQLRGDVVHVHDEAVDPIREVVEHPDRRDGDQEPERGGHERLGDAGRHRAQTARVGGRHRAERVDDADHG